MNQVSSGDQPNLYARLTADEVAVLLKTSVDDVQEKTRRGDLVAGRFFPPPGGEVRYPAFQFDPRLEGPVHQCLQLLGPAEAFLYLASVHPDMSGLTPLEVLLGLPTNNRTLSSEALGILDAEAVKRTEFVLDWAHAHRDHATCC